MGEVFVALDDLERPVVVKRLHPHLAHDKDLTDLFLDEARLGAKMCHPSIVEVLDLGRVDDAFFMVLEMVDGPSLRALWHQAEAIGEPLDVETVAYVIARAAEGLHFAHELVDIVTSEPLQIVHRDVSPDNILISVEGDVKIADFGIAQSTQRTVRTETGQVRGKFAYMSPEQCLDEAIDRRSDVFSLGTVLYELITRRRLYTDTAPYRIMKRIVGEDVPPPSTLNDEIDLALDMIVGTMMAKRPSDRPDTALKVAVKLDRWLARRSPRGLKAKLTARIRKSQAVLLPSLKFGTRIILGSKPPLEVPRDDLIPPGYEYVAEPTRRLSNLEREGSAFFGREADLAAIDAAFAIHRVVALIGPGGVGKTRLAKEFGQRQRDGRSGVVLFCDATESRTLVDLCRQLGRALETPLLQTVDEADLLAQLGHALADRGSPVVIVDNVEQIAAEATRALSAWVGFAPNARFVATSRVRLVAELQLNLQIAPFDADTGVAMLCERAGLDVSASAADDLRKIVGHADGLPLGIELLAVALEAQGAASLVRRLDAPKTSPQDAGQVAFHDAMARTIGWSWDLLGEVEQRALAMCSVFRGGIDPKLSSIVLGRDDVTGLLDALVDKSLLVRADGDVQRYSMTVSVRDFAGAKLEALGLAQNARALHTRAFVDIAQIWAKKYKGTLDHDACDALDREFLNLIEIHRRGVEAGTEAGLADAARATLAVSPMLSTRGPFQLHFSLLNELLQPPATQLYVDEFPDLIGRVFVERASAYYVRGDIPSSSTDLSRALRLAKLAGDASLRALILPEMAINSTVRGRLEEGELLCRATLDLSEAIDATYARARALEVYGQLEADRGEFAKAEQYYLQAITLQRRLGCGIRWHRGLDMLGVMYMTMFRLDEAGRIMDTSLSIARQARDDFAEAMCLGLIGTLAWFRGDVKEALSNYDATLAKLRAAGERRFLAIYIGVRAGVLCHEGRGDEAERQFQLAERIFESTEGYANELGLRILRGHAELAEAKRTDDAAEAKRLRAIVDQRIESAVAELECDAMGEPIIPQVVQLCIGSIRVVG